MFNSCVTYKRIATHVVIPAEDHKQSTRRGRNEHEPVLRKCVIVEQPAPSRLVANQVLFSLVGAIQRREIEIGRRVVDRWVRRRRAEE